MFRNNYLELLGIGHQSLDILLGQGVSLDHGSQNSTGRFNSHGQMSNIGQQNIGNGLALFPSKDGGLVSSIVGNSLIRVDQFLK